MNDLEKKAFNAGFTAGYEKGQNDAGTGNYWLTPPPRDKAWRDYKESKIKPKKAKYSKGLSEDNFRGVKYRDPAF
jgi:hypothetical protein